MPQLFHGLPAAPGIGIGALFTYHTWQFERELPSFYPAQRPEEEWQQFLKAIAAVDQELIRLVDAENSLIAEVFAAQRAILQDPTLVNAVRAAIFNQGQGALQATHQVIQETAALFRNLGDDYFAGRAVDIIDIGQRLLKQMGVHTADSHQLQRIPPRTILVARDLTMSELTQAPLAHIVGLALAESTPTAHSAILARSLGIPMVCALGEAILNQDDGQAAIIDGGLGKLLVLPTSEEVKHYTLTQEQQVADRASALLHAQEPAHTRDGQFVPIFANANSPEEVEQVRTIGADGVGLLRTEYLFQNRASPPSVTEQAATYRHFAGSVQGGQLTVRALDAGGDKPVQYINHALEENPFLGLRGVRLLLAQPELLRNQFRALCTVAAPNASADSDGKEVATQLRFMLPMISTVEEVRAARGLLNEVAATMAANGEPCGKIKVGVMIEVPSAALLATRMAPLVDFFSIGTNDLAQYALATDRTNSSVAALADPLSPAVLRLIQMTCAAGAAAGIPVSLCGEIGGDPVVVPLLLGLGLTELSVPLPAVPLVKEAVRQCDLAHCHRLAEEALCCEDALAVRALLEPQ
ncbi:MAG: phosphoenolpyruvate--protein phosphotransferase [Caldilineaceae bacterium]